MSAKHKNQRFQCRDMGELRKLVEEFRDYIGRDVIVNEAKLELVVLALPRHYKKKSEQENKLRRQRQNRDSGYDIPAEDEYSSYEKY